MVKDIQHLISKIAKTLDGVEGFSTEMSDNGCVIKVLNNNVAEPSETLYDGYELLLYSMGSKKLGHEIEFNFHDTEAGKVFAINTEANLDLRVYMEKMNEKLTHAVSTDIISAVLCDQTSSIPHPFCIMTMYKNGNWLRHDLTMAEVLYAATHDLAIEKEDGAFVYPVLRQMTKDVIEELKTFEKE